MNTHILASKSGFWKAHNPEHGERTVAHSILASPGPTCNRFIRIDFFAAPYALKYFLALWAFTGGKVFPMFAVTVFVNRGCVFL